MLRFRLRNHPRSGSPAIYLDRGLDIAKSKVSHVDEHGRYEDDQAVQEDILCYVATSTYKYISAGQVEEAEEVLSYVHMMFDMCTPEEEKILSNMYINMHFKILNTFSLNDGTSHASRIPALTDWLSTYLLRVNQEVDFVGKFRHIADTKMNITVTENVGTRVHDTPEMTFHREHIVEVMVLSSVAKMLTPILALYIDMANEYVDNRVREIHVAGILTALMYDQFLDIGLKLKNYIETSIKFS